MKSFTYCITVISVIAIFVNKTESAKGKGDCQIFIEDGKELPDYKWSDNYFLKPILDTTPSKTVILNFTYKNINDYDYIIIGMDNYDYVYLDSSDNEFLMYVDADFRTYEDRQTSTSIEIRIQFECDNGNSSTITFVQPIKDTNNHSPTFLKAPYKYTVPMPIPKEFDFKIYESIIARDVDITNSGVTYKFDSNEKNITDGFLIAPFGKDTNNPKNFPAMLKTSKTIDLEEDITFKLFVTDNGDPKRTSETTVTIAIDKENSAPRFSDPLYVADLTSLDYRKVDKVMLQFKEGKNVTLSRGYGGVKDFELRGISDENKQHFHLSHSKSSEDGINIYVEIKNITEKFLAQKELSVILTAVKEKIKGETVLQILLPEISGNKMSVTEKSSSSDVNNVEKDQPTNGFMVATIILSLICLGLLGYVIFLHVKPRFF